MICLGVDLSLVNTGSIRIKGDKILGKQLIKTKATKNTPRAELDRLIEIRDSIIVTDVDMVAIEGLSFATRNTRSIYQLAGLNYMVREHFLLHNIPFVIVAPTTLKKFVTGKGNSHKEMMLLETYKRYGISFSDNNLCDAYGLARIAQAIINKRARLTRFQKEVVSLLKEQI